MKVEAPMLPPLGEHRCQHCGRFLFEHRGPLPQYMRVPCRHCNNDDYVRRK
jgi:ribosomal protein S27E